MLKIERSLVSQMDRHEDKRQIVEVVTMLARPCSTKMQYGHADERRSAGTREAFLALWFTAASCPVRTRRDKPQKGLL